MPGKASRIFRLDCVEMHAKHQCVVGACEVCHRIPDTQMNKRRQRLRFNDNKNQEEGRTVFLDRICQFPGSKSCRFKQTVQ